MKVEITLEEALAKASPLLRRKMLHTVEVIRRAEPLALKYDPDRGFFCGFSGGKDSQALYHMMQLCGVKHHAYFNPSSIDPPENIRFIRKHYPEVEFTRIKESIFTLFKKMKVLPSMRIRYCCSHYKESNGEGKVVCTGVRKAESVKRSKRISDFELPEREGTSSSRNARVIEEWLSKPRRRRQGNFRMATMERPRLLSLDMTRRRRGRLRRRYFLGGHPKSRFLSGLPKLISS